MQKSSAAFTPNTSVLNMFKSTDPNFAKGGDVKEVPLDNLSHFKNHPYSVPKNEDFYILLESIRQSGVSEPIVVRPIDDGYEIISGHRRVEACRELDLDVIPAYVKNLSDDDAIVAMVNGNIHREGVPPSETAKAYKMMLDAIERKLGRPSNNSGQVVPSFFGKRSTEIVGEAVGENYKRVQRFLRLNNLIAPLLRLVDDKTIPFVAAVDLSFLSEENQEAVETEINCGSKVTTRTANLLKQSEESKTLTPDGVHDLLSEKQDKPPHIKIPQVLVKKYRLPDSAKECEKIFDEALELYFSQHKE